jgi:hypothetical protein
VFTRIYQYELGLTISETDMAFTADVSISGYGNDGRSLPLLFTTLMTSSRITNAVY